MAGDSNLYASVDNGATNAFDPLGLCKIVVNFNKVIKGLPGYIPSEEELLNPPPP